MRSILTFAVIIVAASCANDEGRDYAKGGPPASTATVTPPSTSGQNPQMNPTIDANKIPNPSQTVELTEYAIHMPATVPAGTHSFRVMNAGTEKHSFEIEGNGVEARLSDELPRGDMKTIDVTLKPGTYDVYCPVDDHKGKGMRATLVVK